MPNIKSAKKRVRVTEKKTLINMAHKTALKTAIKKFEAAAKAGNKEEAQQLFNEAAKKLDQSTSCQKTSPSTPNTTKSDQPPWQMR